MSESTPARPNVLVFMPHDLGDHLHCYGYRNAHTPNLDHLAQRGVRLRNHFACAAECTPSRVAAFTGLLPHQNGVMGLANFGWKLRPDVPHLARRLFDSGYETCLFGFQHEAQQPTTLGYNQLFSQQSKHVDDVCNSLATFLSQQRTIPQQPLFMHAGFFNVHRPWPIETVVGAAQGDALPYLPDMPEVREEMARFYADVHRMDAAIGRVLEALAASPLAGNTLVIFTSDHGAPFPRAKSTFYDPGLRIPLIAHQPGRIEGGAVREELVSNLDLCPTVLEACGVAVPDGLEGRSMLPLLEGQAYEPRDEVVGAQYYDVAYDPMHYIRTARCKYIRSFAVTEAEARGADPRTLPQQACGSWIRADDADVQSSLVWQALREPFDPPPAEELYDLEADPHECRNLVEDPAHREALAQMRLRAESMIRRTGSPMSAPRIRHVLPTDTQLHLLNRTR